MNETEHERYGRLLYDETRRAHHILADNWADCTAKDFYYQVAGRFIAAAGLVPLAEIKAIVESKRPPDSHLLGDWYEGADDTCHAILVELIERYGLGNSNDHNESTVQAGHRVRPALS